MDAKHIGAWLDRAEDWLAGLAGIILCFIVGSVCLEIIMRYFFRQPLIWVVELTEYGLLYITFLAAPWLLKHEGHVQMDLFVNLMSPRWKNFFGVLSSAIGLLVSLVVLCFGTYTTYDHFVRKIFKVTVLQFPTWIVLLCIPIGSLFLAIRFWRRGIHFARARRHGALREQ